MITSKTAFFLIITLIILGVGIYFVSKGSSKGDLPTPDASKCAHCGTQKCDPVTGECIVDPDRCNGVEKPTDTDICKYICMREKEWVCKGSDPCEKSYLPSDIGSCKLKDLVCDPVGQTLYCPKDPKCNGFNGYFIKGKDGMQCACDPTLGPTCKCDPKMCGDNGKNNGVDENGNCICKCNDPTRFFGPLCDQTCTNKQKINIDGKCACDPSLYTPDGDNCKPIPCANGTLTKEGKCTCNPGYKDSDGVCITICGPNQEWNGTECVCKKNTDFSGDDSPTNNGTQYYPTADGKDCNVFNCHYADEFTLVNGVATCDCKEPGSCGPYCQYTRTNSCSGHGNPTCDAASKAFTNVCVCDAGFYGVDCSCSSPPSQPDDICKGIYSVCNKGTWTTKYKTCTDIKNDVGSDYEKNCFKEICGDNFYNNTGSFTCEDSEQKDGQTSSKCVGCPKDVPICKDNKVSLCDGSTSYNWTCVNPNTDTGNCANLPQTGFCQHADGTSYQPTCITCGSGQYVEFVCDDNNNMYPSDKCLSFRYDKKEGGYNGYSGTIYFDKEEKWSNMALPVYPTTYKDACEYIVENPQKAAYVSVTSDGQFDKSNVSNKLANPIGSVSYTDNNFSDLSNYSNSDSNRYFEVPFGENAYARCPLPDQQIIDNILKVKSNNLCSSSGTFVQKTINDSNGKSRYIPDGSCTCNQSFRGTNCQYSDAVTCNGRGTVDDNGKCTCTATYKSPIDGSTKPYFGLNCEKSDADCKVQKGANVMYGSYNANAVCDYGNLCATKFPRCQSCANTTDYSQMTCTKAVDGFDTANCKENPFDGILTSTFGCPIIQDTTVWSKYTGLACNQNGNHVSMCASGASMKDDRGFPSNCSGSPNICPLNYCSASDFTTLSGAPTKDKNGLTNTTVSSISLAGLPNANTIYYLPSDNNLEANLGSLSNDIQKACNLSNASIQNASQYPHTLRPFAS
jgi:hypothetical protein